jgi:hypothetical protein
MAHSLMYQEVDEESLTGVRYKQTVNAAAHLLNIIQTSNNTGLMLGDREFSVDFIKNLLRITFSATVVVFKTSDTSSITALFTGGGGNSTAVAEL